MSEARTLQEIAREELYEDVECYGCGAPAVITDVNGLDLCQDCADGRKLPEVDA